MSACEKCWGDAYLRAQGDRSKTQTEHYMDLLEERKNNPCGQEEPTENNPQERLSDKDLLEKAVPLAKQILNRENG